MAKTSGVNTYVDPKSKSLLDAQIDNLKKRLLQKLKQYKKANGVEHRINIIDGVPAQIKVEYDYINPKHYVQDDGKQTWERMVDKWGEEKTALWCEMTAFKYQDRIGKKPGEDIKREQDKIKWYEEKADELNVLAKKKKFW
jgi:hypothetical protein